MYHDGLRVFLFIWLSIAGLLSYDELRAALFIWLSVAGFWYARMITLYPYKYQFSQGLLKLGINPTKQSALVGIVGTNIIIGALAILSYSEVVFLFIPNLYLALAGLLVYWLYYKSGLCQYIRKLPEIYRQHWIYTVVFCLLPILSTTVHFFIYEPDNLYGATIPIRCYLISGGMMILAQEIKYHFQVQGADAVDRVIDRLIGH